MPKAADTRAKISAALAGRPKSPEQRAKMSAAQLARRERERATGNVRRVQEHDREAIIQAWANGADIPGCVQTSGWGQATVRMVLDQARAEGDLRAHQDPAIRAMALQRAASGDAHREGGANSQTVVSALPPNSVEASLVSAHKCRPEVAAIVAKVFRDRRAREQAAAIKAARERAPLVVRYGNGPFRIGAHAENMRDGTQ